MFKIIKYSRINKQLVISESDDYEEIKKVYDAIKPEEKLAGEDIFIYELIEEEGKTRTGIALKSDIVIMLDRK